MVTVREAETVQLPEHWNRVGTLTLNEVAAGKMPVMTACTVRGPTWTQADLKAGVVTSFGNCAALIAAGKLNRTTGALVASAGARVARRGADVALASVAGSRAAEATSIPDTTFRIFARRTLLD